MKFTLTVKIIYGFVLCLVSSSLLAFTPTAAQIEQFKNLPKAQQATLAKQYGVDLSSISAMGGATKQDEITTPIVVQPKKAKMLNNPAGLALEESMIETTQSLNKTENTQVRVVKQQLKQFGYDLFAGSPTTFAPATDIPVPVDYVMGPGDSVKIQLFGKTSAEYEITVDREGNLVLPELGILSVIGLSFDELKHSIANQYHEKTIGVKPAITLGSLRSIRIFMLGGVNNPGAYTVSSLSTLTNALFVSGGIAQMGSLRNIQLKRNGTIVTHFDLYDLLLKGDTSKDVKLLPGDVIFAPPIGMSVGIRGEIRRPAIYELKENESLDDLLTMAGGYLSTAYPKISRIARIQLSGDRSIIDVDLTQKQQRLRRSFDGDIVEVFSVLDRVQNVIQLKGHVLRAGGFAWKKNIRISNLINSVEELQPKADLNYALIVSETKPNREIKVNSFILHRALSNPGSFDDKILQPRDKVYIFGIETNRANEIESIIEKLQVQERANSPAKIVSIVGNVKFPGVYPLVPSMTLNDLLTASFEAKIDTDYKYAILERKLFKQAKYKAITLDLETSKALGIKLLESDKLYIFDVDSQRAEILSPLIEKFTRQVDKSTPAKIVSVFGNVKFPGLYPLSQDMQLKQLLAAAGGYTESAYTEMADLTRFDSDLKSTFVKEHQQIDMQELTDQNKTFILQSRDILTIKQIPEWRDSESVLLSGEFTFPGRYEIKRGDTLTQVIQRAGGFTSDADLRAFQFSRKSLKVKEDKQIELLKQKLRQELASNDIQKSNNPSAIASTISEPEALKPMLNQLDNRLVKGRLALNLPNVMQGNQQDIDLRNGDELFMPIFIQEVTVIGQVQQATSHVYNPQYDANDYIGVSGGETQNADSARIYVIKVNGEVKLLGGNNWFGEYNKIEPGDTIVVPLDTDQVDALTLWTSVSQIIYQFGLAAAAINSLSL